jgi:hypothetical protein
MPVSSNMANPDLTSMVHIQDLNVQPARERTLVRVMESHRRGGAQKGTNGLVDRVAAFEEDIMED